MFHSSGVDVVVLKRPIAIILLKSRAQAYRAIYDAVKTPRSDIDHSLSPRPAPLCALPARVLRSPLVPLPLHQPLWIGQWTPVNGLSCVVVYMFCICH